MCTIFFQKQLISLNWPRLNSPSPVCRIKIIELIPKRTFVVTLGILFFDYSFSGKLWKLKRPKESCWIEVKMIISSILQKYVDINVILFDAQWVCNAYHQTILWCKLELKRLYIQAVLTRKISRNVHLLRKNISNIWATIYN